MQIILDKINQDMEIFFRPYFNSQVDMLDFYNTIAKYDSTNRIPCQMINQIYNFVTLANDIEKIRPKRDSLRILFLKMCLESLAKLSNTTGTKKSIFYDNFATSISNEGKNYILNNFNIISIQDAYRGMTFSKSHELSIKDFFRLIKVVRDKMVHDGNYWEVQFFSHDNDSIWSSSIKTNENFLNLEFYDNSTQTREYYFETTLNYEKFIYYFVEGCLKYVKDYMQKGIQNS